MPNECAVEQRFEQNAHRPHRKLGLAKLEHAERSPVYEDGVALQKM